jgi:hypothetical protein
VNILNAYSCRTFKGATKTVLYCRLQDIAATIGPPGFNDGDRLSHNPAALRYRDEESGIPQPTIPRVLQQVIISRASPSNKKYDSSGPRLRPRFEMRHILPGFCPLARTKARPQVQMRRISSGAWANGQFIELPRGLEFRNASSSDARTCEGESIKTMHVTIVGAFIVAGARASAVKRVASD